MTIEVFALVVALATATACQRANPNYCAGAPRNECPPDARPGCDCAAPTGVCEPATTTCVQCTPSEHDACTGATPACIGNVCSACTAHDQCTGSGVCLPDGTCAAADVVAYVQAGGAGTACTQAAPCASLAGAINATPARPYVKLSGQVLEPALLTITRPVDILADPDATLLSTFDGDLLRITAAVNIYDLRLTGVRQGSVAYEPAAISLDSGNPAVTLTRVTLDSNDEIGVSIATGTLRIIDSTISRAVNGVWVDGGRLTLLGTTINNNSENAVVVYANARAGASVTVDHCQLSRNIGGAIWVAESQADFLLTVVRSKITDNAPAGGIHIDGGQFAIVGNQITNNGMGAEDTGGINIHAVPAGTRRIEFNTIVGNRAAGNTASGIHCAATLAVRNNIVFQNDLGGNCVSTFSVVGRDPLLGQDNLHLRPNSPALGAAAPDTTFDELSATDIDGDRRSAGADVGADEVP